MGSGASKSSTGVHVDGDEKAFFNTDTPIKFDQALIDHLSDLPSSSTSSTSTPSAGRQSALDSHVRQHLKAELERLQREESDVKKQIFEALEKENLDKERGVNKGAEGEGVMSHSESLMKDLEDIQKKVDRHRERRDAKTWPEVAKARESVIECLLANKGRPLDCWKETEAFKKAVGEVERVRCLMLSYPAGYN